MGCTFVTLNIPNAFKFPAWFIFIVSLSIAWRYAATSSPVGTLLTKILLIAEKAVAKTLVAETQITPVDLDFQSL